MTTDQKKKINNLISFWKNKMSDEERYAYMLDFDEEDLKENLAKYFKL